MNKMKDSYLSKSTKKGLISPWLLYVCGAGCFIVGIYAINNNISQSWVAFGMCIGCFALAKQRSAK